MLSITKSYIKIRNFLDDCIFGKKIKFLHIGKTGGTFIKDNLKFIDKKHQIRILPHSESILKNDKYQYIFFVRNPTDRFISAFWSRYRKGKPRYYSEWNKKEKEVFEFFKTPNDLAEAIYSSENIKKEKAKIALENISHLNMDLAFYLKDIKNIESCLNNIYYVGRQETINDDLNKIIDKLGYDIEVRKKIKYDEITKHKTSEQFKNLSKISNKGIVNIKKYYSKDFEIIEFLEKMQLIKKI